MGLKEDLDTVTVSQLNIRPPITVSKSATVREAVGVMRGAKLGCVVVVDDDGKAVGIYTEALLRHELNDSVDVLDDCIEKQMAERLPWVLPTDPVRDVETIAQSLALTTEDSVPPQRGWRDRLMGMITGN